MNVGRFLFILEQSFNTMMVEDFGTQIYRCKYRRQDRESWKVEITTDQMVLSTLFRTRITITKSDKYPRPYILCHSGNNSLILHRIFTKVASCTSTTLNEHFCQV